jgi:hypothetical protein
MKRFSSLAVATAALMLMSYSSGALAQTAPATGNDTAPAASTAPAPATPAPTATTAPATTTTPAATQPDTNSPTTEKAAPKKKTAAKKRTRQQEIEHSIDTGTVPARYRSSVPKQYQHYIPFDKQ